MGERLAILILSVAVTVTDVAVIAALFTHPTVTVTEHGKPCPHHRSGTSVVWRCP